MRKLYIILTIALITVLSVLLFIFDLFLFLPVFFCFFPYYCGNRGQRRRVLQEEFHQSQDVYESEQYDQIRPDEEIQHSIKKCPICGNMVSKENLKYCEYCGSKL